MATGLLRRLQLATRILGLQYRSFVAAQINGRGCSKNDQTFSSMKRQAFLGVRQNIRWLIDPCGPVQGDSQSARSDLAQACRRPLG